MKLLVIANRTIEFEEIRAALLTRAASGPVQVKLVAPASGGGGSMPACRAATAQRLAAAVQGSGRPAFASRACWGISIRCSPSRRVRSLPLRRGHRGEAADGVSRWMAAGLPHRVERLTGARVTHIVATA